MNAQQFQKLISNGHHDRYLYHFTDSSNVSSIAKYGLLSKRRALEKGVEIAVYGGNKWSHDQDARKGLDRFVNLCFTTNHPMLYVARNAGRIKDPKYLVIDPKVVEREGVMIALGVANAKETEILNLEEGVKKMDTEVLYTWTNWKNPEIRERRKVVEKYELLVPNTVPRSLILGIK